MGVYLRFGSASGSVVPATLIPIETVAVGNQIDICDFGAASGVTAVASVIILEVSNNAFAVDYVEVSRIEIPTTGTVFKSLKSAIRVKAGQSVRVRYSQSVAGSISAELYGQTLTTDIVDI